MLVTGQFVVGYRLGLDDCDPAAEELNGADTNDVLEDRLDRLEDACEARADGTDLVVFSFDLTTLHLLLGLAILTIAVVRPLWRRYDGFPTWSDSLSAGERRLVHWTERSLMALLFAVPLSGLLMIGTGDDGWLPLHVTAHVAFFLALAAHLFTNLRPSILRRML